MTKTKSIIFIVLFVTAIVCVGRILYDQQNIDFPSEHLSGTHTDTDTDTETFPTQNTQTSLEILDANRGATTTDVTTLSRNEYTKENSLKHLPLTRDNIIWYTNYERVKNNFDPLSTSDLLINSAREKNLDMVTHQYFNHVRSGNPSVSFDTFISAQNYEFIKIGENLAMGDFSTSAEVVTTWMKSPSHRKNILDPIYHNIGVHIRKGTIDGRMVTLITQHFGDPRSSCPTVNAKTKKTIDAFSDKITELQNTINKDQKGLTQFTDTFDPRFNSLVENYNKLILVYNQSIKAMSEVVNDYNKQIHHYDQCIQGKQQKA